MKKARPKRSTYYIFHLYKILENVHSSIMTKGGSVIAWGWHGGGRVGFQRVMEKLSGIMDIFVVLLVMLDL